MRQNFEPSIWGSHAWFFLETIVLSYSNDPTDDEKKQMKQFFLSLQHVIPCEMCSYNYKTHLQEFPLNEKALSNRDELFKWIITIHNSVESSKKRTPNQAFNYYNNIYSNNKSNKIKQIMFLLILICIIVLFWKKIYK